MSARSVGLGSMFGWVPATFGLVKRNFGAMSVASLLNLCLLVLMMVPMFFAMYKFAAGMAAGGIPDPANPMGGHMGMFIAIYCVAMLVGLLVMPPLMAGWFQLCEDADRGAAVRGTQIMRPYANGPLWLRLIGFVLLGMLLYLLVFAALGFAFSGTFMQLVAMQTAQNAALLSGQPAPPPSMAVLGGVFVMYAVMLPVMFLLQFVYMVGLAEVSLRSTPVLVAFKDALATVLRNSLKLLVFLFVLFVITMVVVFVVALVVVMVVAAATMLSPAVGVVLAVLMYIPILLVMYPLMFAGNYVAWKSLLGGEPPTPPAMPGMVAA